MAAPRFWPRRPTLRPRRKRILRSLWLVPLLVIMGALLDPALVGPIGPLAAQPERVSSRFTPCGPGRGSACVIDGDTFKLGERKIRLTGIDAPEIASPQCAREAALARRSSERLRALLNEGPFDMIAHRFNRADRHGRDLMVVTRGDRDLGHVLVAEGLAHRYLGSKSSWCG